MPSSLVVQAVYDSYSTRGCTKTSRALYGNEWCFVSKSCTATRVYVCIQCTYHELDHKHCITASRSSARAHAHTCAAVHSPCLTAARVAPHANEEATGRGVARRRMAVSSAPRAAATRCATRRGAVRRTVNHPRWQRHARRAVRMNVGVVGVGGGAGVADRPAAVAPTKTPEKVRRRTLLSDTRKRTHTHTRTRTHKYAHKAKLCVSRGGRHDCGEVRIPLSTIVARMCAPASGAVGADRSDWRASRRSGGRADMYYS